MDASSSVQVLLAVIALTGLLTGLIRALGAFAAAAEFLETESVRIHSVVELPPGDGKWPRQGRFRRHKPHRGLQF